jgi:hypothetical protein
MALSKCPVTGKVCHTKEEAKRAARWLRAASASNFPTSAYLCPHWEQHPETHRRYHAGHTPYGSSVLAKKRAKRAQRRLRRGAAS